MWKKRIFFSFRGILSKSVYYGIVKISSRAYQCPRWGHIFGPFSTPWGGGGGGKRAQWGPNRFRDSIYKIR